MKFDEETQTWVEKNLQPKIDEIDSQIKGIEDEQNIKDKEFELYSQLLQRTRMMINEVQTSVVY